MLASQVIIGLFLGSIVLFAHISPSSGHLAELSGETRANGFAECNDGQYFMVSPDSILFQDQNEIWTIDVKIKELNSDLTTMEPSVSTSMARLQRSKNSMTVWYLMMKQVEQLAVYIIPDRHSSQVSTIDIFNKPITPAEIPTLTVCCNDQAKCGMPSMVTTPVQNPNPPSLASAELVKKTWSQVRQEFQQMDNSKKSVKYFCDLTGHPRYFEESGGGSWFVSNDHKAGVLSQVLVEQATQIHIKVKNHPKPLFSLNCPFSGVHRAEIRLVQTQQDIVDSNSNLLTIQIEGHDVTIQKKREYPCDALVMAGTIISEDAMWVEVQPHKSSPGMYYDSKFVTIGQHPRAILFVSCGGDDYIAHSHMWNTDHGDLIQQLVLKPDSTQLGTNDVEAQMFKRNYNAALAGQHDHAKMDAQAQAQAAWVDELTKKFSQPDPQKEALDWQREHLASRIQRKNADWEENERRIRKEEEARQLREENERIQEENARWRREENARIKEENARWLRQESARRARRFKVRKRYSDSESDDDDCQYPGRQGHSWGCGTYFTHSHYNDGNLDPEDSWDRPFIGYSEPDSVDLRALSSD